MESNNTPNTREKILQAADRLVLREGVGRLTIEAVAREAGVSKGGVLYHFPSKDGLIEGMVTYLLEEIEATIKQAGADDHEERGHFLRSLIQASASRRPGFQDVRVLAPALLAAMSQNPQLLEPLQRTYATWQERVEHDGLPPDTATLIRLAAEGLWFAELFGLAPPSGADRQRLVDRLLALTRGTLVTVGGELPAPPPSSPVPSNGHRHKE